MQAEELTVLVDQARRGNSQAFIDLMASAQRDLRVFIGTFACSAILAERVFSETISDARRQLIDCPATPSSASRGASPWPQAAQWYQARVRVTGPSTVSVTLSR